MKHLLKLNQENLGQIANKVTTPTYDRSKVKAGIVHVGIGGFHRAHQAYYTDQILHKENNSNWGICGVALLEFDTKIYNTLKEQDGLYTLVVKELDGSLTKRVIGSIVECLYAPENPMQVIEKMASPDIKIITLTITEGGYNYNEATKAFDFENPHIEYDLNHPTAPKTIFGYLTQALKQRMDKGLGGVTIQSCDNIKGNGDLTKRMLLSYVQKANPELVSWIASNVTFPNSMVDRITPATSATDILTLTEATCIDDDWPVVCEPFHQWVIEDDFIAGRPAWETVGARFVEDVDPFEKMKLALLNAGHTVLGILGALRGYNTIDQAVYNPDINQFLKLYMDLEVTPILTGLEGVNLDAYKTTLLNRFGNIYMKDQIDRICSESSAKFPIFILPTINAQLEAEGNVEFAAFIVAAWAIYSLGKNEQGEELNIKDAMSITLAHQAVLAKVHPDKFLELEAVFGKLRQSDQFVNAFIEAYKAISENGVEQSVKSWNKDALKNS